MEKDVVRAIEKQRMRESNERKRKKIEEQQIMVEVNKDHLTLEDQTIMRERHMLRI